MLIEKRLEAARTHLAAGREDDAALLYEGVLDVAPTNRTALKELALIKLNRGDVETAMRLASGAAARAGADPEALALLARAALAAGKPDLASAALEQALEFNPHHAQACILKAGLHFQRGEYTAAENLLHAAIEHDPSNVDLLAALGGLYSHGGIQAPALDLAQRALAQEPDRPELIALLGSVLARLGDHEKALPLFERVHLLQPGNPLIMVQLADTLFALGQLTEAHRVAKRAVTLFEAFLPAWVSYVKIMAFRNEAKQALTAFGQIARKHPDKAAALLSLALSYRATGNAEHALRMIEPLLAKPEALDPGRRTQADAIARDCLLSLGRLDEIATTLGGADIRAMLGLPEGPAQKAKPSDNDDDLARALEAAALVVDGGLSALETLVLLRFDPNRATAGGPTDVHCLPQLRDIVELVDHVAAHPEMPQPDRVGGRRGPLLPLSALLTLPPALRGGVAASVPYVTAQGKRHDLWRRSLAELPRPLIALAWETGRPGLLLEDYRPLFSGFDGTLVAVTWDAARHQLAAWPEIIDGGAHFGSLADLAAVIAETDAVIGPDGIPLHVAGAMARPGALLTMPDWPWYWHHEAGRSSWYPTITVLQSETFGNWEEKLPPLMPAIAAFLDGIAHPSAPPRPGAADRAVAGASPEVG